jgi:GAF domain-containing protein/HAMP domain-containing protein
MLLVLLTLTIIPMVFIGAATYRYGRDFLRQQAFTLLGTVANTQGRHIVDQVDTGALWLERTLGDDEFLAALEIALSIEDRQSTEFTAYRNRLIKTLQVINQPKPFFNEFLILKPDGTIHISTQKDWQGERIKERQFMDMLLAAPVSHAGFELASLYEQEERSSDAVDGYSIESFVITTAIPYTKRIIQESETQAPTDDAEPEEVTRAYIIGIAESPTIREFIINSVFYSEQVYFVTPGAQFIGLNPYPNSLNKLVFLPTADENKQIFLKDLTSEDPRAFELDASIHAHRNPVIAARAWFDDLGVAWTVELDQSSVYGQIDAFMRFGVVILGVLLILSILAVLLLTRSLTSPVLHLADTVERFAEGNWEVRSSIERRDEVGVLSDSFNRMAEELSTLYGQLESQVRERTGELNTLAQLSQIAITSRNLDDLLKVTLDLLVQRFNLTYAAVFLVDQSGFEDSQYATLRQASGSPDVKERANLRQVRITDSSAETLAGWVIATNRPLVRPLKAPANGPNGNTSQLQYFEAAIPIATSEMVLGAINLFATSRLGSNRPEPFSSRVVSELQTFANQIAAAVRNFQLIEASRVNLDEASMLFQASHQIAQSKSVEAAQEIAVEALEKCPYRAAILLPRGDSLKLEYHWINDANPRNHLARMLADRRSTALRSSSLSLAELSENFTSAAPLVINDLGGSAPPNESDLPDELLDIPVQMDCDSAAFLPVVQAKGLTALLILGSAPPPQETPSASQIKRASPFTMLALQPYANLIELLAIMIEKIRALEDTQKRLVELETIWKISQTISIETDLTPLFHTIHSQIEQAMGELSTIGIGLYDPQSDMIHFPYMFEEGQVLTIQPIPLGQGLTSKVLRSKEPLLLVEDAERKTQELGAITVGKTAKSWLGVPLMFAGEAIGIIIVQDNEQEHRFNEEDQRLLSTLAAQMAVAVHNARLLEGTRSLAEQERLVNEIASKLRRSVGIQDILKTTAVALGGALGLRSARIEIQSQPQQATSVKPNGSGNGSK